jgi:peptidyl-prolyl cis-trans isomerase SurA
MDRFRLLAGAVIGLLGSGTLVLHAQERPPDGPPPAPATAPTSKIPTNPVQPVTLVSRPTLRAATSGLAGLPEPTGSITASVVARVNGQPILAEEVMGAAAPRLAEAKSRVPPEQFAAAQTEIFADELENIINRELVLQDAAGRVKGRGMDQLREAANKDFDKNLRKQREQLGLKTNEELRDWYAQRGISLDEARRQKERSFVAMEYIRNLIRNEIDGVDREQMLEYYRQNPKEFEKPERVVWQWIWVDIDSFTSPDPMDEKKFIPDFAAARRYADMILVKWKAVRSQEEFNALVEQYAHGPSKRNQGQGEGQSRGQIRPAELENVLFNLQPGQFGSIVETPTGLHLVRVTEHTPGGKTSFEEACPEVKRRLQNKIGLAEYNKILKELRAKALIESAAAK